MGSPRSPSRQKVGATSAVLSSGHSLLAVQGELHPHHRRLRRTYGLAPCCSPCWRCSGRLENAMQHRNWLIAVLLAVGLLVTSPAAAVLHWNETFDNAALPGWALFNDLPMVY